VASKGVFSSFLPWRALPGPKVAAYSAVKPEALAAEISAIVATVVFVNILFELLF